MRIEAFSARVSSKPLLQRRASDNRLAMSPKPSLMQQHGDLNKILRSKLEQMDYPKQDKIELGPGKYETDQFTIQKKIEGQWAQ